MIQPREPDHRILALDPTTSGFGYVVLESPGILVDWGNAWVRPAEKGAACALRALTLVNRFRPDIIVLEDHLHPKARRSRRVGELLARLRRLAERSGVRVRIIPRQRVLGAFADVRARDWNAVAAILAGRFPELATQLPPKRKPWMSEDPRLRIFTALALAVAQTHYRSNRRRSA